MQDSPNILGERSGKGYDHGEYKEQMRQAVEQWAKHIEQLVGAG